MSDLEIYCVTNKRINILENFKYKLAIVGSEKFENNYLRSDRGKNIFDKEKYYSELTFHYWYWKNKLDLSNQNWVGFCQKRRFWINKNFENISINKDNFKESLLTEPDPAWCNYESIICNPISVRDVKNSKLIKRGWKSIIRDPSILINKNKKNLLLHFDMHHGHGNLKKAISVMNNKYKHEFYDYVSNTSILHPNIMCISKTKILNHWFDDLFEWLFNCEKLFGFENLKGYDTGRLYAYLAERFLPFWFKKNTKYLEWPWIFFESYDK